MFQKMKKAIAILMVLTLCLSLFPSTALAAEVPQETPAQEQVKTQVTDDSGDAVSSVDAPSSEGNPAPADTEGQNAPSAGEAAAKESGTKGEVYPQTQTVTLGDTSVTVTYDSDTFAMPVNLHVSGVSGSDPRADEISDALNDLASKESGFDYDIYRGYEILFRDDEGTTQTPGKPVSVKLTINGSFCGTEVTGARLVYIPAEGEAKLVSASVNDQGTAASFTESRFGLFALTAQDAAEQDPAPAAPAKNPAAVKTEQKPRVFTDTAKTGDTTVSVSYPEDAFSESVSLYVRGIAQGSARYAAVQSSLDSLAESTSYDYDSFRAYDISFLNAKRQPVEPAKAVTVQISIGGVVSANTIADSSLVHITDAGAAELVTNATISDDAREVSFTSSDFSVYVVTAQDAADPGTYTVGTDTYGTLADAINAVSGSGTIWVVEDSAETASVTIPAGKTIVLKTSGGTLTINAGVTVEAGAALEINDGVTISPASGTAITNGGTLNVKGGSVTSSGSFAINNSSGRIESISGGTISASGSATGAINGGTIGTISGGVIEFNRSASTASQFSATRAAIKVNSIDAITGGTIRSTGKSGNGIYVTSDGSIGTISGGTIIGTGDATSSNGRNNAAIVLYYNATIGSITGGSFEGPTGINVSQTGATISSITGGRFGNDNSAYGLNVAASNTITTITGSAAFTGKNYAINNTGTVGFESGITAPAGTVLLRNPSNAANLLSGVDLPAGYRMSKDATSGGFYYVVKDNTVIYQGNGAVTADGKSSVSEAGDSASVTIAGNPFEIPAGYTSFSGWNTKADGSGTPYAAGDSADVPAGGELVLYAQWAEAAPYTITVKHSFNYLVDGSATGQFTWRTNPVVSEGFSYAGANDLAPKALWEKCAELGHVGAGISVQGGGSLTIGALMDVDLDHPSAPYPFTYKLTSVTVDGTEVSNLTSAVNFTDDAEVVFHYELVPIEIVIDYDADVTGEYKGSAYSVNRQDMNLTLAGSDHANYLVSPKSSVDMGWDVSEQPWTVSGSRTVVGSTTVMPKNALAAAGTADMDSSTWQQNGDGTYQVPSLNVGVEYTGSAFHGVSYSSTLLPAELFSVSYKPVTITVTAKPLTITVIDQTHIANGSAQGEDNAAYTNIKNETPDAISAKVTVSGLAGSDYVRSIKLNGSKTEVGEYADTIEASDVVIAMLNGVNEYARTSNYDITLVAGKLTIESNETTYTVKHLQQNIDNDAYTEVTADQQVIDAAIGDEVTPAVKTYEGFETPAAQTVTVEAGGKTVVEYKYDRKQITATFDANGHGSNPAPVTGKYGAALGTLPEAPSDEAVFDGWYTENTAGSKITAASTLPSENVTYYAHWKEYVYEDVQTGAKFTTLQDAIDAASDGDTIRVTKPYTDTANATVPAGKSVTLDTSENALTLNGSISVNGGLTIGDGLTVQGSGTTMTVNSGATFTMNGGSLISTDGNGLAVSSGATATLNGFEEITGTQAAIDCYGTITKIAGSGTVQSTQGSNAQALWVQPGGHVGEIAGGTFVSESGEGCNAITVFAQNSSPAIIDKISGGTFQGGENGLYTTGKGYVSEISGGTFSGEKGMWATGGVNGIQMTISGGTFNGNSFGLLIQGYGNGSYNITRGTFTGDTAGIANGGVIDLLEKATIKGGAYGLQNAQKITSIRDVEVTSTGTDSSAVYNSGTITEIVSGSFTGKAVGLESGGKIIKISGGSFTGENGIVNAGTISEISVANEGDLVVTGKDGAAVQNNGGTISTIEGAGVYIGTDHAIASSGGTVKLEMNLPTEPTDIYGFGRFQTSGNSRESELTGVTLPENYHVSYETKSVSGQGGAFRYLVHDNLVTYEGNGHELLAGKGRENGEDEDTFLKIASTFDDNDFSTGSDFEFGADHLAFSGWNTKADGSGTAYAPGDTVTIPEGQDTLTVYAQWGYYYEVTVDGQTQEGDGQKFADLQDAINATDAEHPLVLTLVTRVENKNYTVPSDKNVILKVVETPAGVTLTVNGKFDVTGGLETHDHITVNGGDNPALDVADSGNLAVKGGTYTSNKAAIRLAGGTTGSIEDAAIDGKTTGIENSGAITVISGSTIFGGSGDEGDTSDLSKLSAIYNAGSIESVENNTCTGDYSVLVNSGSSAAIGSITGGSYTINHVTVDNSCGEEAAISNVSGTITKIEGVSADGRFSTLYNSGTIGTVQGEFILTGRTGGGSAYGGVGTINNAEDGTINEIVGGTFKASDGATVVYNDGGTIKKISGGTYTDLDPDWTASEAIYNSGTIELISGGDFVCYNQALYNVATITEIRGGTFRNNYADPAVYNDDDAVITTISGGAFINGEGGSAYAAFTNRGTVGKIEGSARFAAEGSDCHYAFLNRGTVNEIAGGTFEGRDVGLMLWKYSGNPDPKVETISGGTFTGKVGMRVYQGQVDTVSGGTFDGGGDGILVNTNGTIDTIVAANEGDVVIKGVNDAIWNNEGTVGHLIGGVVLIARDNAIVNQGTLGLEDGGDYDLTAADAPIIGYARYQTSSNTADSQLYSVTAPSGYHMSGQTRTVDGQSGKFHYLVKDNTIIYDGNGHELLAALPTDVTVVDSQVYDAPETTPITARENQFFAAGTLGFVGWNTKADGSGTAYAPGAEVTIPASGELILYAQWGYYYEVCPPDQTVEGSDDTWKFVDLQDAINATTAERPQILTLVKRVENKNYTVPAKNADDSDKKVILNVVKSPEGVTLTVNGSFDVKGELVMNDHITINGANTAIDVQSGGKLTVNGGEINASGYGVDIARGGEFTSMSGGEITVTGDSGVGVRMYNADENTKIKSISGGKITAAGKYGVAIFANGGVIENISGGEITGGNLFNTNPGSTGYAIGVFDGATANITGGKITGAWGVYARNKGYVAISGGEFEGVGVQTNGRENGVAVRYDSGASGTITGGTFHGISSGVSILSNGDASAEIAEISNAKITGDTGRALESWNHIGKIQNTEIYSNTGTGIYLTSKNGVIDSIADTKIEVTSGTGIHIASKGTIGKVTDTKVNAGGTSSTYVINNAGTIKELGEGNVFTANVDTANAIYNQSFGKIEKISGGTVTGGSTAAIYNRGVIDTISDVTATNTTGAALQNLGGTATVDGVSIKTGVITTISGGTFTSQNNYALYNQRGTITTISDGTFDGAGTYAANLNQGEIETISGGTFGTESVGNGMMLWNGTIGEIKGSASFTGSSTGIWNWNGEIETISGGKIQGKGSAGLSNDSAAKIGTISGGEFSSASSNGMANSGEIKTISGGEFTGASDGIINNKTISEITGGTFTGTNWFGIWNNADGAEIGKIAIAEGTTSVFTGGYAAIGDYQTIGTVTGHGVFIGGSRGTLYSASGHPLETKLVDELDLNNTSANPGYGRYAENAKILDGTFALPTDYHMSKTTTKVAGQGDTPFHYLTKDNTVIYDGNGHALLSTLPTDVSVLDSRVFDSGETHEVTVRDNEFFDVVLTVNGHEYTYHFAGWNTEPDGSGAAYAAGSKVTVPVGEEVVLYAQWTISVTITANDANKVYDGTALTEGGFTVKSVEDGTEVDRLPEGDDHVFTVVMTGESTITNAGTQPNVIATVDGVTVSTSESTVVGQYYVTIVNGTLTVNKRPVKLTSASDEKPYDGTALTNNHVTIEGGFAPGEGVTTVVTGSQTPEGSSKNTFTYTANPGTNLDNYEITKVEGTLKVTGSEDNIITVKANSDTVPYDGTDHSISGFETLTFTINGNVYTVEGLTASAVGKNAGTYPAAVTGTAVVKNSAGEDVTAKFTVKTEDGALTITKVAATVTAVDKTKTYGNADPELTVTVSGLVDGDAESVIAYTLSRETGENVGSYAITPSGEAEQENYTVTFVPATLTITKATATVTAADKAKTYGDADPELTAAVTGLKNGDAESVIAYTLNRARGENVGDYAITPVGDSVQGNYDVVYVPATLTISKATVTVTAADKSKIYGDADPALTARVTGLKNDESESVIAYTLSRADGENVGSYAITPSGAAEQGNYDVTYVPATLTITKATATVTAESKTKTYGDADPTLTAQVTGLKNGDSESVISYTLSRAEGENVGSYAITATGLATQGNYDVNYVPATLTITKAAATVTADDQTKVYGDSDPTLTAQVTGLKNGDAESVIAYTLSRETGEDVGSYAITPSGEAEQGNYDVTYVPATLTITKATATVTAADNAKTYGDDDPELTAAVTGLKNGDAESVIAYTLNRARGENVGDYAITPSGDSVQGNYEVVYVPATLTISKATVTVTAESKSKTYGDADPALTATVSGLKNDESESVIAYTLSRADGENVGSYAITPSGAAEQGNYDVTYVPATLTITKATATVTAADKSKTYGDADPELTASVSGLKNGDAESVISYTLSRAEGENVGSYAITATGLATQGNYDVNYVPATLTITKAAATVTAESKTKTYGDADPTLTAQVTGLKNGDAESVISYTLSRAEGEDVGSYAITPSGAAEQGNYDVTYVPAALTITKAPLTITAIDQGYVYNGKLQGERRAVYSDAADILAKVAVSGLKGTDTLNSITLNGAELNAGVYEGLIQPRDASLGAATGNYEVTYVPGKLTIERKAVTITAEDAQKVYDGRPLTAGGFAVSELEEGDTHGFVVTMTDSSTLTNVGTQSNVIATVDGVPVTAGTAAEVGNYKVTTVNGTLTVQKRSVVLESRSAQRVYNGTELTNSNVDISGGFARGEGVNFTVTGKQLQVGSSENTFTYTAASGTDLNNYDIVTRFGTLTVLERDAKYEILVQANSGQFGYDGLEKQVSGLEKEQFAVDGNLYTVEGLSAEARATNAGEYNVNVVGTPVVRDAEGNDVSSQFRVRTQNGTMTITKAAVTVTAADKSKGYGDADPELTASVSGLQNGEAASLIAYTLSRAPGENAGSYTITPSGAAEQGNYTVTYVPAALTITKAAVTVTAENKSKTYGDGDPALTAGVTGLKNGDSASVISYALSRAAGEDAGTYAITPSSEAEQGNYTVTYVSGTLTINRAPVTVTAESKSKAYGDADPELTAAVTGLRGSDTVSYTLSRAAGENVGTYAITPNGEAEQGNYTVTFVPGTLTINRAVVTVTAESKSKTYGDTDPELTAAVTGLRGSDTVSYTLSRAAGENAGTYAITASGDAEQGNYTVTFVPGTLTINRAPVTVAAEAQSKEYGEADPELTATVSGLKNGDAQSDIVYTLVRASGENAGRYDITPSGAAEQGNYTVTYVPATLTITKAPVTVTAESKSKTYGDGDPALTAGVTGLKNGDSASVISYALSRAAGEDAGTYAITPSGEAEQANYKVTYVPGTLTINRAPVTVTAESKSKAYGDADPELTAAVTGLRGSDTVSYTLSRAAGENVGTYAITPSGETEQGNYTVTFVPGTLTITRALVTVTAESKSKTYGDADPELTAAVTGLNGSDTVSYTLSRAAGENAGTYAITASGEAEQGNYTVTFVPGTLTINRAPVTVAAEAQSKEYGDADPELTATVSGLKNGDAQSDIVYTLVRASGENAGRYDITPSGAAEQGNYTVTYVPAKLIITKASVTVTAVGKSKTYGDADPALTAEVTGLKRGDRESLIGYRLTRAPGEDVGTYAITFAENAALPRNYTVTYVPAELSITHRQVVVAARSATKTAGQADPALTATVTGLMDSDTVNYTLARAQGETAGTYDITASGAEIQGNYRVSFLNGTMTIVAAAQPAAPIRPTQPDTRADVEPTPAPVEEPPEPSPAPAEEVIPDADTPLTTIPEEEVPQAEGETKARSWALINLLLAIASLIAGLVQLVKGAVLPKDYTDDEKKQRRKKLFGPLPAVAAVLVFLLTEDIRGPMALVDKWTILMVLFPVLNGLITYLSRAKDAATTQE